MLEIIVTILICAFFFVSCYYMGNWVLGSLDGELKERIVNSLFGILCWCGIAAVVIICVAVYEGVSHIL
jgi:hypothetical protein